MDIEEDKLLMREIAKNQKEIKKHRRISFIIAGMVVLLGFLPLVISGFIKGWDSKLDTNFEMSIFLPAALAIISSMIILLVTNAKRDVKITRIFKCEQLLRKERAFNPEFTTIEGDFYTQMTADEMYKTLYAEWEKNEIFVETLRRRPNEKKDWILILMTFLDKQRDEEKKKQEEKPKKKRKKKTVDEAVPLDMETVKKELKAEMEAEQAKIEEEKKKKEDEERLKKYISVKQTDTKLIWFLEIFKWVLVACVIFIPWGNVLGVDISFFELIFNRENAEVLELFGQYPDPGVVVFAVAMILLMLAVFDFGAELLTSCIPFLISLIQDLITRRKMRKKHGNCRIEKTYYLVADDASISAHQKSVVQNLSVVLPLLGWTLVLLGTVTLPIAFVVGYGELMNAYTGWWFLFAVLWFAYIAAGIIWISFSIKKKEDLQNAKTLLFPTYKIVKK